MVCQPDPGKPSGEKQEPFPDHLNTFVSILSAFLSPDIGALIADTMGACRVSYHSWDHLCSGDPASWPQGPLPCGTCSLAPWQAQMPAH